MRNKQLRIVAVVVAVVLVAAAGLTVKVMRDSVKHFPGDGYVLVPSRQAEVTTDVNEQYYFAAGTSYREKFGETISFKDTSDHKVNTDTKQFVHYLDGSLAAFSRGVVMNLADVGDEQVTYYGVSDKTTIMKEGQGYAMTYMGDKLEMGEFIWKLAEDRYMIVTPQVTLHLNGENEAVLEDYVQLQYVDGGIVRLIHQQGTYQTVADNAYLVTDSGIELNLMKKAFTANGEEILSLDAMVIDSSANLNLDEDEEGVKIPTFNVVNGKDGEDGDEGGSGEDGTMGEDGQEGVSGAEGDNGNNGYDGQEGNSGDWGYDGKDGTNGENAQHAGSNDGIASIEQEKAPTVSLETATYAVGPNHVLMNLKIDDPNSMLQRDLSWSIYNRNTMAEAAKGTIPRGVTSAVVSTSALQPDTEYVLVVSGSYATDVNVFDTDFFTKIFSTDTLGLRLEKVQATDSAIKIRTVMSEDSMVGSYSLALFDEAGNRISSLDTTFTTGTELEFRAGVGLENGVSLSSDTNYKVRLTNLVNKDSTSIGADVSMDIMTLKTTPYYEGADHTPETRISVGATNAVLTGSDRYQTISINMDTGIQDPDSGIQGYRYELYEVSTLGQDPTTDPVFVKELQNMQTTTFSVDREKNYVGRVVVLFHDNEKLVELPGGYSQVTSLNKTNYPIVQFVSMKRDYDSIEGYIMVDNEEHEMLLDNISADYPLTLTMVSEAGTPISIPLYTEVTAPDGSSVTGDNVKYYHFSQDGLRRNTRYSLSVSGPVNDSGKVWNSMSDAEKKICAQYYLAGVNVDTGDPDTFVARYRETDTADNLFTVQFGITGLAGQDASYEAGNMEKVSFSLLTESGEVIGTAATLVDADTQKHTSEFSSVFSAPGTAENDQNYDSRFVLTDSSFGAKGDSRIAAGGVFYIRLNYGYDYTDSDGYPDYTNAMNWEESSMRYRLELETRHMALNRNNAVKVEEISNAQARESADHYEEAGIADETTVGLKIMPDYRWDDAKSVTYYIYEVGAQENEPLIAPDTDLDQTNWVLYDPATGQPQNPAVPIEPVAVKTVTYAPPGTSNGMAVQPWIVYFADKDSNSVRSNLDDSGRKIFERGRQYFVRYEVTTNGKLGDTVDGDKYPDCVYPNYNVQDIPFYRSQVFSLSREIPGIQRYLWDTVTDGGSGLTTQVWKYRITDPDNALVHAAEGKQYSNVKASVREYTDFNTAAADSEGTAGTALQDASMAALYGSDGAVKSSYEEVSVSGLSDQRFYTMTFSYELYTGNTQTLRGEPVQVNAVSEIKTDVLTTVSDPTHPNAGTDYTVSGVMVKGVGSEPGLVDDYGYRIRLTLQGSDLFRVAALKVSVSARDKMGQPVTVVYDPVGITMADGKTGTGSTRNSYGYAYLDYAPIVQAGINSADATVQVEAYYTTYQAGMKSFTEYAGQAPSDVFTDAGKSAWAMRQTTFIDANEEPAYNYNYLKPSDENGTLAPCQLVREELENPLQVRTLSGSVFRPKTDDGNGYANAGFWEDIGGQQAGLSLRYALDALCTTEKTGDEKYSDVLFHADRTVEMDNVGMWDTDAGAYHTLERLELKTLQIDCGESTEQYQKALFRTGDGMPGIAYSTDTSIGMHSAALRFTTKGQVPNENDKGMYIYLYQTDGSQVKLTKYRDADGNVYYLADGSDPTSDADVVITDADDGTSADYGVFISPKDGDVLNGTVEFNIRGLKPGTAYYAMVKAKDTNDSVLDLFDYQRERGAFHYEFTTTNQIEIMADSPVWQYNLYNNKRGSMQFGIRGSEGTGMRIYYKLYNNNNQEITWGGATGNTYVGDKGYLIPPLGNQIKYYSSDKTLNNQVNVSLNPGVLILGDAYKVVLTAYSTDNDGNILENTPIGQLTQTIRTPNAPLTAPRASLRVVPGKDSLSVTVVMSDPNKVIKDDTSQLIVYDGAGNQVWSMNVTASDQATYSRTFTVDGLAENSPYTVRIVSRLDRDNNGSDDNADYTNTVSTATVSTATASVNTSYGADNSLILTLRDRVNFDSVKTVMYSIDSADGSVHYVDESVALELWSSSSGALSHTTPFVPEAGTYSYMIQYYDTAGRLLGTTAGYFSK